MSHVTIVETELDNLEVIEKAINFLGLKYELNGLVRMWHDVLIDIPIVIKLHRWDIGVVDNGKGSYMLKADSYAWSDIAVNPALSNYTIVADQGEQFAGILKQACNIIKAIEVAKTLGHTISLDGPDSENNMLLKVMVNS